MTTKSDIKQKLETEGHAFGGITGGPGYTTYWTPSGKKMRGIPSIREFVYTDPDTGEKETGTRDATPGQRGWLTSPPQILKLDCISCKRWHDTQEEVDACVAAKAELAREMEEQGMADYAQERLIADPNTERIDALQGQVDSLVQGQDRVLELLEKLTGGTDG